MKKTNKGTWKSWKRVKCSSEKEFLTFLKEKKIFFEELANERIDEIQNLTKQIDFNNVAKDIYWF